MTLDELLTRVIGMGHEDPDYYETEEEWEQASDTSFEEALVFGKQAIRDAIERAKPTHLASPIAVGFPQAHADSAFLSGANTFEANLLYELGLDDMATKRDDDSDHLRDE